LCSSAIGTTGILNICHAGFYGIGAYTAAILSLAYHSPLLLEIVVAAVTAASVATLISLPSIRLHDDVFVLAHQL
jgi:ABC-type branched-subunit amino acid transport system permease subunit